MHPHFFFGEVMAVKKFKKSSNGLYMWETISSSVQRRPKQDWCAFYTPQGRMVSKPAGRRPRDVHPEDWCSLKTQFKGKVIRSF